MTSRARLGLVLVLVLAAALPAAAERRAIRTFTAADGLPRDQVRALLADSRGFLWLGTREGLARFDGDEFTLYGVDEGLTHDAVRDLLEDRQGRYWVATGGGLFRFTPGPREFLRLRERGRDAATTVPAGAALSLLEDRDGVIWCGSSRGLFRVTAGVAGAAGAAGAPVLEAVPLTLDPTEHGQVVGALLEARDGALWIGTGSGLFRRGRDGRVDRVSRADGLPDQEVWALAQDAAGYVWVGTRFGLVQIDASRSSPRIALLRTYTERDGLLADNVKALSVMADGAVWAGLTSGVVRLVPSSTATGASPSTATATAIASSSAPYTIERILSGVLVTDLTIDSAGNLWIASDTGAMRLAPGGFVTYGAEDGLDAAGVRSLFEDRQGRLCATVTVEGYRVQCFDGRRFTTVSVPVSEAAWNPMWGWLHLTVEDRDGAWWFPAADGLYRFAAGPIAAVARRGPIAAYGSRDGLDPAHVFRLFEDSRGDFWMSTYDDARNGLCRRERATGRIRCYGPAEGLPTPVPAAYAFAEDRAGRVWIGFQDGHLARCDARCTFVMRDNETMVGAYRDLHLDRAGRLWIASGSGGLARIDDPLADAPSVVRYTTADGLASQTIWAMAEDDAGRMYLAGGRGVDRLDPRTREIVHYSEADGLARGEVRGAMRAADGTLWFAAAQGLSRLSPTYEPPQHVQPVRIVSLRIAGAAHPVSDAGEREIAGLRLAPQTRSIEIAFVSPRFGVGRDFRYQYRLEGLDAQWQPPTRQQRVTYGRLPAGTHRFAVRAVSADGRTVSPPAIVAFTIDPPLWQRWWFLALLIGLAAAALHAWHRGRLAKTVEIERVRTRIAGDLHDEIGAGLSEIAILSEVTHQRLALAGPGAQPLTLIATTSRELVDAMSDIVWAINPRKDSLVNLTQRMRRFATDLLTARGIEFRFDADARDGDLPMSADKRRHVFLIFKESLNNIVRHAGCRHVAIDFRVNHDGLVLCVADDGQGLAAATIDGTSDGHGSEGSVRDGHGLASMSARARELDGTLTVSAGPAGGTMLTLRAPIARHPAARLFARLFARLGQRLGLRLRPHG